MGIRDDATPAADIAAIDWARSRAAFADAKLITDSPWSRTYRFGNDPHAAYLKIVPAHQAGMLDVTARLAGRFGGSVPKVLAVDAGRGWMLTAAHGARELDYDSPPQDLLQVAQSYARLQVEAAKLPGLGAGLPQPELDALPQRLLNFLQQPAAAAGGAGPVGAAYFVGAADAARYHRLLARRVGLLRAHLKAASRLPTTINHGDLRPPNTAIADDGSCVILDWDDALLGPAGMSLHGLFRGCAAATIMLSGSMTGEAAAATPIGRVVWGYLETLAAGGYADAATLRQALPAAMCAGMLQFMLNFAQYPGEGARADVEETLRGRFSDLLDLCDLLSTREPALALELATSYEAEGELRRAHGLLQDQAARHQDDLALLTRFALLCRKYGELEQADEVLRHVVEHAPGQAHLHAALGAVLTDRLLLDAARHELQQALVLDPASAAARADLDRVAALQAMLDDAALPGRMPILRCEPRSAACTALPPEHLALGVELFKRYGTMQIDNAFSPAAIERLQAAFFERYTPYFQDDNHPDALRLGDKRYMLTVDMEQPFDDPGLIGSPTLLPILREVLGENCVLGAFTAVISLPGSRDQRLHKDHPALFPDTEWHYTVPCFAAQITIPLVALDEFTGTTRVFKGTHRVPTEQAEAMDHQDPVVPLGSCLMTDYRTAHRGLGNRSDRVRPILTLIFNRPWFHDFANYGQQPPLRLPDASYERLPEDVKELVAWWKEERKVIGLDQSVLL